MLEISRSSRAELDLVEIAEYLGKRNPDAAIRVLDSIEATFHRLAEQPDLGTHPTYLNRTEDGNVRMKPDLKFPIYLIFFEIIGDYAYIHRVIHARRDLPVVFEDPDL
ncbi:MAG: plasmid stabilization system protein ParE [Verrucomicrobiales bacterium]|jgi:plasmid stabilization system protein ParE